MSSFGITHNSRMPKFSFLSLSFVAEVRGSPLSDSLLFSETNAKSNYQTYLGGLLATGSSVHQFVVSSFEIWWVNDIKLIL